MKVRFVILAAILAIALAVTPAAAQTVRGSISGVVKDTSGAVISGAKVTLVSEDTGATRNATSRSIRHGASWPSGAASTTRTTR